MAQEYIKIRKSASDEWLVLPQPDSGALSYDFETTYTEDSGRTQTGAAVVSPLFTVEALGIDIRSKISGLCKHWGGQPKKRVDGRKRSAAAARGRRVSNHKHHAKRKKQ